MDSLLQLEKRARRNQPAWRDKLYGIDARGHSDFWWHSSSPLFASNEPAMDAMHRTMQGARVDMVSDRLYTAVLPKGSPNTEFAGSNNKPKTFVRKGE